MANNNALKKIAEILILTILTSSIFVSCDKAESVVDADTTDVVTETAMLAETEDTRIYPDLPEYDWEGYNFRILTADETMDVLLVPRDIAVEEETGVPLNDAVYYRNRNLEERYNFTIEQIRVPGSVIIPIRDTILAGDEYFDAVSMITDLLSANKYAQTGLFVELSSLEYLDLQKPWWDQGLIKNTAIGGKLFALGGASTLINSDASPAILFNKGLIEDYQLENPYELVRNNQWTLDKFSEMAKTAAADLNGNQQLDRDTDRYGLIDSFVGGSFSTGAGVRYAELDKDGLPYLTFANERNYDVINAVCKIIADEYTLSPAISLGVDVIYNAPEQVFSSGRGLFYNANMRSVESLRGSDVDFGILPFPKYDENQKEWGQSVNGQFTQLLCVPNFGNSDALEKAGFMLEAIASESMYTTLPAWYEIQLTTKFARDAESKEMIDIILNSMVWDPYRFYGWGDYNPLLAATNGTVASSWASGLKKTELEMNATVKGFEKLD